MRIELKDVIKSPDVEDPVNLHVHRPLQLALARPLVKTAITPNQVTFLSLCAGLASAALIVQGSPIALLAGAGLLFSSARVLPAVATTHGYEFAHATVEDALRSLLDR